MDNKSSIFTKRVIGVILLGTLIPLAISLILSAIYNGRVLLEENISLQSHRLSYTVQHVNSQFAAISDTLRAFSKQSDMQELFDGTGQTNEKAVSAALADLCYIYPSYANAYICSVASGQVYSAYPETDGVVSYEELLGSGWYAGITHQYGYTASTYPFSHGSYLACVLPQRDPVTLQFVGYYMVKVKTTMFGDAFEAFSDDDTALHCITTGGEMIAEQSPAPEVDYARVAAIVAGEPGNGSIRYEDVIICWKSLSHADILIFSLVPRYTWQLRNMLPSMVGALLAALCITAGLYFSITYLRQFLRPVNRLAETMQNANLNQLERIEPTLRNDEIAILERCYNNMVDNFNQLLDREYRASLAAQEAQINSLQLQINPHFVNNTLQMIGAIAVERNMMDVYELLQSFSSMFYYCLKFKGNIVSLQDELDYLASYIMIQKERYPDKFEISIQVDEQVKAYEIPKMALQPIVENCFTHAFRHSKDVWRIRITAALSGCGCEIRIEDNGCGMAPDDLRALRSKVQEVGGTDQFTYSGSIGLRNVNTRMRLLYGGAYQLQIDSAAGVGTTVIMRIPNNSKGASAHDQADDSGR
uniref:Putative sensor histidine-kinase response regulator n=1 Tax=termite gut metagenome TaxID=433724 RepID=S0DGQ5_9ZZZZ